MPEYFTRFDALFALCLVAAFFFPSLAGSFFRRVERIGTRCARQRGRAVVGMTLVVIVARLCFMGIDPVPAPQVHDEFAHLLAGDTFAHGRLTNPTPSLPLFFETFHVNLWPTYMSKYPPGQGAVLAVGELIGNPWIGVLLSVAVMCGALLWMLRGWVPSGWALLGAALAWLHFGLFNYWVDSYWGGAVAATGGALVMGALPRIMRWHRLRDAVLMGLGVFVLANSRPFEGLLLSLTVAVMVAFWPTSRHSPSWRGKLKSVVLPLSATLACGAAFVGYYNWRLTGNAFLLPEVLNHRKYMSTPLFIWEKPREMAYPNLQFESFYNVSNLDFWTEGFEQGPYNSLRTFTSEIESAAFAYLWPVLWVPILAAPCFIRDRKIRYLTFQILVCAAGSLLVVWFLPHYAAPMTASIFLLATQAMRHLRLWRYRSRPVGVGLMRVIGVFAVLALPYHAVQAIRDPGTLSLYDSPVQERVPILRQLESMPGKQLVIVRYSTEHSPHEEWVYNEADIEGAKVVWAREIPGVDIRPLLEHFEGRKVWLVEPDADAESPKVTLYSKPE
jgi:hypothetical protein